MSEPIPYAYLDPGVRDLVRDLAGHGFSPTDSGDGVSKCEAGMVLPFLHVFMVVDPAAMSSEADRLHALLPELGCERMTVEAVYRPSDGEAVLALLDLPDDDKVAT